LTDVLMVSGVADGSAFSLVQIAETVSPTPKTEQVIAKGVLYKLVQELKKFGKTTLLTSELPEGGEKLSADGISEFITDGVVVLKALSIGESLNRTIELRKMRYSPISGGSRSYELNENGFDFK